MSDLADAANDLAALLEAAAPRQGLRHPSHARIIAPARKKVERVLRHYFHRQMDALLSEIKPKIAVGGSSYGVGSYVEASGGGILYANHLLPTSIAPLRFPVTSVETIEFNDAMAQLIKGAVSTMGESTMVEDVVSRWLRDNSLTKLTGDFSATSINRLRDAMADAWDAGGSFEQITAAIKDTFADFSDTRAGMIAQTEVNDAYNEGRIYTAINAGFDQKAWDPDGEACEICMANVDAEWIDIDAEFPSGDMAPTAHPNCDCSIDFQKGAE